ncbi:cytochrome c-type biogenesis protein CcmH [Rhodobacteraceae bacterium]|nr:cytochrome c-type biogenesis protein CcmH [Paracoccaceae bacterium]
MRALVFIFLMALSSPALAVLPDEVLHDPSLEARARQISQLLRCPVCQGENIDDSNAGVARDLRLMVRARVLAGDSNQEVLDYISARYGEYVLFSPQARGINLVLYLTAPIIFVISLLGAFFYLRRRRGEAHPGASELSAAERARLKALLED